MHAISRGEADVVRGPIEDRSSSLGSMFWEVRVPTADRRHSSNRSLEGHALSSTRSSHASVLGSTALLRASNRMAALRLGSKFSVRFQRGRETFPATRCSTAARDLGELSAIALGPFLNSPF